jgi:hypothetical protein
MATLRVLEVLPGERVVVDGKGLRRVLMGDTIVAELVTPDVARCVARTLRGIPGGSLRIVRYRSSDPAEGAA